jgi:hypothetical protein
VCQHLLGGGGGGGGGRSPGGSVSRGSITQQATEKGEVCTGFWWGNLRERDHWGDLEVDGRNLQEVGGGWGDWMELAQDTGQVACACEYGIELSVFIKCREFLD